MSTMHISRAALLAALVLTAAGVPAAAADSSGPHGPWVTRIVTLDSAPAVREAEASTRDSAAANVSTSQGELQAAANRAGLHLKVTHRYRMAVNGLSVDIPVSETARLTTLEGVASVSEPATFQAPEKPTPVSGTTVRRMVRDAADRASGGTRAADGRETVTATDLTGVPEAHRAGATGKGVVVGIIDGGIAYDHPAFGGGSFPGAKVIGGYDFADGDADPYDDANGSAAGHGTHVAGIIAGDDDQIQGVAPDARLRSYRVFGTGSGASEEVILAALDRAAADGDDIVNMSLGSAIGARSGSVLSTAVDTLVRSGTLVTVANGNGYAGPFRTSEPAVADEAMAVGSTYNDRSPALALSVRGVSEPVAYLPSGRSAQPPASGAAPWRTITTGCAPLPKDSLKDTIAVITPDTSVGSPADCRPLDVARTVEAAGAEAAVLHDPKLAPDAVPIATCCGTTGIPLVSIAENDAKRALAGESGPELSWGAYAGKPLAAGTAGLMDPGSAWGPGNELEFKPAVAAPGGSILSALPKALDWYGVMSGTSMAAPHVAGAAALLLQHSPELTPRQIRGLLQNTATPLAMTGDPGRGDQPVAQQGAGRVNVSAALDAAGRGRSTEPSALALHDLEGRVTTRRVTVRNDSRHAVTYSVGHRAAVAAAPPYTSEWQPADAAARVTVHGPSRITVPAHGSRNVEVAFREPSGVPEGTIVGGWVEFVPTTGHHPLRVPYQALVGDFDAVSAINPTFSVLNPSIDNPALRPTAGSFGKNAPLVIDLSDDDTADDRAAVMVSHGFPLLKRLRLQVLDARGRTVATPYDASWVTRNSGAGTGVDFYTWNAERADGTPAPAGTYRLRLVFDKALGDPDRTPGTETWTSPPVTVGW